MSVPASSATNTRLNGVSYTHTGGVCDWARSELARHYHDTEWGVPEHDEHRLFEMLVLEGAQAGLSWVTILHKRERYREVYEGFDPAKVARYRQFKIDDLLADPGIVRNRQKVHASVQNARAFLDVQKDFGSFDAYLWGFVDGKPIQNGFEHVSHVPARTELSDTVSRDLKKRGFTFVGSTIVYAFMQAVGVVNDHEITCPRYEQVRAMG